MEADAPTQSPHSQNNFDIINMPKPKFYKIPWFYIILIMTLITSSLSYIMFFEFPKFVTILSSEIDWIFNHLAIGMIFFFIVEVLTNILCIPLIYQAVILGYILSKVFNLYVSIFGGSVILLSSSLIAGIATFQIARLFKKWFK